MITIKLPIDLKEDDKVLIKELQKQQTSVIKTSYQKSSLGLKEKDIRHILKTYNLGNYMDSWFIQSAIIRGNTLYKADVELFKIKKSKKKNQNKNIKFKNRVFGGKKNFIDFINEKKTKEEYKDRKLDKIYLIGEACKFGNRKFNFLTDSINFKINTKTKIEIKLPSLRKNYNDVYNRILKAVELKKLPLTISIDENFIYITYDEKILNKEVPVIKPSNRRHINTVKGRYAGIDLNPGEIGLSIFDKNKNGPNPIFFRLYRYKNLSNKKQINHDKLNFETKEIAHEIGRILQSFGVEHLFMEDLSFDYRDKGNGKAFNRITMNAWKLNCFKSAINKWENINIFYINPMYSSLIGNLIYNNYPDAVASSMEIARRGMEVIIKKSEKFFPDLIHKRYLEELWKQTKLPDFESWKELHLFIKNSKLKYRVPVHHVQSFRFFRSHKSKVKIYSN